MPEPGLLLSVGSAVGSIADVGLGGIGRFACGDGVDAVPVDDGCCVRVGRAIRVNPGAGTVTTPGN